MSMTNPAGDDDDRASMGVLRRAGLILRALSAADGGLSLGQIAKQVGLARSTVQRLVSGLETEGFVDIGGGASQITLGLEFFRLARIARPRILERLHPVMLELSAETGETTDLSAIRRSQLLFVNQVIGSERLLAVSRVGDSFPLHCSSVGKSYLAMLSVDEISELIGTTYPRMTKYTRVSVDALAADLKSIQETGVGYDVEEHSLGIGAIGIAFEDDPGEWYGLSVPLPIQRFEAKRGFLTRRLQEIKTHLAEFKGTRHRAGRAGNE